MNLNYNTDIIEKVGQAETVDSIHKDTNNRIYSRVIPSQPLQPMSRLILHQLMSMPIMMRLN